MNYLTCVILFVILKSDALCYISREIYNEIKERAPFEVLDYETIQNIFKGVEKPNYTESLRKNKELHRQILEKINEKAEEVPFLAFTQQPLPIPKEFDWRKVKPECFTPPKHQMNCGSCYIFAPIAAFESRLCISSGGKIKEEISQQDVLSCAENHYKCSGGLITDTWEFLEKYGACSYKCKPYISFDGSVPACKSKCDSFFSFYTKWKAQKDTLIQFGFNETRLKYEIYTNGPINAFMETWEDLAAYKSGLYFHTTGKLTDPHAITIVGWGYDENYKSDFWIIRNSWGPDWGENGYLKVLKGLYKIGDFVAASLPQI